MLESQLDQMLRTEAIRNTGRGPSARVPDKAHLYSGYRDILQRTHLQIAPYVFQMAIKQGFGILNGL